MKALFKQKYLFWVLQLVGWNLFFTLLFLADENEFEYTLVYRVSDYLKAVFSSILVSSILRWVLKNNFFGKSEILENLNWIFFLKVIGAIFFSATLLILVNEILDLFTEDILLIENEYKINKGDEYEERSCIYRINGYAAVLFLWTLFYLVIKLLINNNRNRIERLQLTNELKEAQLNTLKGQINPHFMFNSLNNIRGLMLEDVHRSREMLTKLSDMLRYSLTKNGNDAILLAEELEMVDNYIELSKIQMEDRLQFQKYIDQDLEHISVPPMLLQLLVENAAKHGISNQKNGGIIKLTVTKDAKDLLLEVTNTGSLNIAKNSTQLGLKNIKERLRLLYGEKATFSLNERNNEVIARIKIKDYERN